MASFGDGRGGYVSGNKAPAQALVPSGMRVPPQSMEAEKALLGSIMLRPDVIHDIIDIIRPETFYAERNRSVYETMLELQGNGNPIDILSVSSRLKERGQFEKAGGNAYLASLVESVPSAANVGYYSEIVHKKHMMRRLIEAADHISQLGYNESIELENVLDDAQKKVFEVTNVSSTRAFKSIGEELPETMDRLGKLHEQGGQLRGVPTGFASLDNKLSGFQKSDLIILAARPSVGKTALALDFARNAACVHNIPVGIFSLEMSAQQLIDRMVAAESRVDAWKMRTGKLNRDDDFRKIHEAVDRLSKAPIYIDDQPGNNIIKMRSVARRLKGERGLGLIIVDYLQLMAPTNTKASDSVVQQVTEISRSLKHLARELEVPVIALSQLSRAVEQRGGKPRLSDLRDSGSIEQDADVVAFIHREDYQKTGEHEKTNIAEILIEKHRNGPTGSVQLFFDSERGSYQNLEKADFSDFDEGMSDMASF